MGRGTDKLVTCWIPLEDVTFEVGGLCVVEGSSSLPGYARMRETYGSRFDVHYGDETSRTPGR